MSLVFLKAEDLPSSVTVKSISTFVDLKKKYFEWSQAKQIEGLFAMSVAQES